MALIQQGAESIL